MARQSHDREDLLREASALVPRVQLRLADGEVIAGFRGESLSLYFDADPVYHFNARGELRRAFVGDRLLKAEHGRLVALERRRGEDRTAMVRHELTTEEADRVSERLIRTLGGLGHELGSGHFAVVGQFPADADALPRLIQWVASFRELRIAASSRVGG